MNLNEQFEFLVNFIRQRDEAKSRELLKRGSTVGLGPMKFGPADAPLAGPKETKSIILIDTAIDTLDKTTTEFAKVREAVEAGLGRAGKYRLWSAIITTVLSSTVIASVKSVGGETISIVLGFLTLGASILTIVAGRLEGGETNIAQQMGEVAGFQAEAVSLLARLRGYRRAPELFDDVEAVVNRSVQLVTELERRRAIWRVATSH